MFQTSIKQQWDNHITIRFGNCTVASWLVSQCEQHGSPDKRSTPTTALTVAFWAKDCSFGTQPGKKKRVKNGYIMYWRHRAPNCIMLIQVLGCNRHPMHFSPTVGSCLIATRPKSLAKVRTTVACFAPGHRALYKDDLKNMDVSWMWLTRNYAEDCWTSTWHRKDFGMQTGTTFPSTWRASLPTDGLHVY